MMSAEFRTRAASRDAETTAARRETVRRAITTAMREATRELAGLEHRLADAYITGVIEPDEAPARHRRIPADDTVTTTENTVEAQRAAARAAALRAEAAEYAALLKTLPAKPRG